MEDGLRVGKPLKEAERKLSGSGAERVLLNNVAFGDGELNPYYCTTLRHGPLTAPSIFLASWRECTLRDMGKSYLKIA